MKTIYMYQSNLSVLHSQKCRFSLLLSSYKINYMYTIKLYDCASKEL